MLVDDPAVRACMQRLWGRWPDDDPIRIVTTYQIEGGIRIEALADCGWRVKSQFHADLPLTALIDEDTMVEAARAGLRTARNRWIERWQAQILEA